MRRRGNIILSLIVATCLFFGCKKEVIYDFERDLQEDLEEIDAFLSRNNIQAEIHETQARYEVARQGTGALPEDGDTLFYLYTVYLLDSTLIQTNRIEFANQAFRIQYFEDTVRTVFEDRDLSVFLPPYFQLANSLTPEKGLARVFVPSYLAFGANDFNLGVITVPPSTPIMIEIENLEIR